MTLQVISADGIGVPHRLVIRGNSTCLLYSSYDTESQASCGLTLFAMLRTGSDTNRTMMFTGLTYDIVQLPAWKPYPEPLQCTASLTIRHII